MRLPLRSAVLLLVLYISLPNTTRAAALPASYPKPHLRFKEKKGTMGFVYAAVLGPVGYFGVRILSPRSQEMRYQAGRGFKFWGYLVATCAILAACAALGGNGDSSSGLLSALWASF